MKKKLTTVLAIVLVVSLSVAGTYAYLTAQTDNVTNTFAVAGLLDGNLTLKEHEALQGANGDYTLGETEVDRNEYTVVPGVDLPKDPTVKFTLQNGIGAYVYLAVKNDLGAGLTATIDETWGDSIGTITKDGATWTLYAKEIAADAARTYELPALQDNVVLSAATVAADAVNPYGGEIVFNAYLCQSAGFDSAMDAWTAAFGA